MRSRVTPGVSSTIAIRRPVSLLKSIDLPTFGLPTMATMGFAIAFASFLVMRPKEKRRAQHPPLISYRANLLSRFHRDHFTTVVEAASLAGSVRQTGLTALRASDNAGDRQFPMGAASLISSRAGYFSLRNCHLVHLLGLNAVWHIVYFLSRSCCKIAKRGSFSGWQVQAASLRFAPQRKQTPLQSSRHSSLESMFSTNAVVKMSSRSA